MKPSKTIFLAFTLNRSVIAEYFLALAQELIRRDYKIVIITANQKKHLVSVNTNPAIVTWPSFRPTKIVDAFFLVKLIRDYSPIMIISNFVTDNWCLTISTLMGVPVRAFFQHLSYSKYQSQKDRLITKFKIFRKKVIYKLATDCFPVSEAMAQEAVSIFHLQPNKIKVFYNALKDPLQIYKHPEYLPELVIFCAGQLIYRKGQDVLVQAMPLIKNKYPNIKLTLLGEGNFKPELIKVIDQLNLHESVAFLGNVSHSDVLFHMKSGYLVVVPSRAEAFGYVVIEAMSVGTPVIASNVGGIPEIIRDGLDGFLVPPGDPEALAEKILVMLGDPNLRKQMSANARQRYLEKFELTQAAKRQADWLDAKISTKTALDR